MSHLRGVAEDACDACVGHTSSGEGMEANLGLPIYGTWYATRSANKKAIFKQVRVPGQNQYPGDLAIYVLQKSA